MQSNTTVFSIAAFFFKIAAIMIAKHVQKTLHWQLTKVILSGIICTTVILNQQARS